MLKILPYLPESNITGSTSIVFAEKYSLRHLSRRPMINPESVNEAPA